MNPEQTAPQEEVHPGRSMHLRAALAACVDDLEHFTLQPGRASDEGCAIELVCEHQDEALLRAATLDLLATAIRDGRVSIDGYRVEVQP
jgi:hypothetical protein